MHPENDPTASAAGEEDALMAANDIVRILIDFFHWNGYRYSTLKDALAASKRARASGPPVA